MKTRLGAEHAVKSEKAAHAPPRRRRRDDASVAHAIAPTLTPTHGFERTPPGLLPRALLGSRQWPFAAATRARTMSWELRLWLPTLPESLRDVDFSKVERRTDLYALGLGDDVGVKRRNGTDLEIKRREKRKKRGAEKWRKTKVEATDHATWISCEKQRAKCTLPPPHDNIKVEVADVRFENGMSSKSIAFEKGKPHELYAACGSVMGLGDEWTADDLQGALGSSGFVGGYPTALLRFVSSPDERTNNDR